MLQGQGEHIEVFLLLWDVPSFIFLREGMNMICSPVQLGETSVTKHQLLFLALQEELFCCASGTALQRSVLTFVLLFFSQL